MPLTDIVCKSSKSKDKPYKISDEKGLYLEIMPNGSKYWRLKYRFADKEKRLAFGVYPEVSLAEARERRDEARKVLRNGIDPAQAKKDAKHQNKLKKDNSFYQVAVEWHETKKSGWTPRHASYVIKRLQADIFPTLGEHPINEIKAPELLSVIRVIENRGALDIAHRALQTCGQIFRFAIATGRAEYNPTSDLRGALKTPIKTNYSHLKESELPEFFTKLKAYDGQEQTQLAMKLLVLTFVRTGELRGARWEEINFDIAEWRIPAERMKMREQHIVPLSKQTVTILKKVEELNGKKHVYVFPNYVNPTKCISENTLLYALYRMGYHSRTTIHGFRATASTILNEKGFHADVIERQLAHSERNRVRASYNYAQYLKERVEMMQWWADYLEEIGINS